MSTLRTNALEGMDAKNSITIVAGAGNITTTSVQEGIAKAWVNITGTSTTVAKDSFNVSGLTDTATGRTQVAINNNMNNDDFAVGASSRSDGTVDNSDQKTTGNFELMSINNGGSAEDSATKSGIVHGDLA